MRNHPSPTSHLSALTPKTGRQCIIMLLSPLKQITYSLALAKTCPIIVNSNPILIQITKSIKKNSCSIRNHGKYNITTEDIKIIDTLKKSEYRTSRLSRLLKKIRKRHKEAKLRKIVGSRTKPIGMLRD